MSQLPFPIGSTDSNCSLFLVQSTSTELLPKREFRNGFVIQLTTDIVYIKYGPNCSDTDYSYRLTPRSILEDTYCGLITAYTDNQSTFVFVTEKL